MNQYITLPSYERRSKLKQKGIRVLPKSGISHGYDTVNGKRMPLIIFEDRETADRYTRRLTVAGDSWHDLPSRLWDHNGWYADSFGGELVKPAVCLMGKAILYGYEQNGMLHFYSGKGEAERYEHDEDSDSPIDTLKQFARYADSRAETIAEECREYNEKWQQARKLEDRIEEMDTERRETLQDARAWVRDCKGSALTASLCERIRGVVTDARRTASRLLEEIMEAREQLKGLPEA